MNNDDERDEQEEAYNRALLRPEGEKNLNLNSISTAIGGGVVVHTIQESVQLSSPAQASERRTWVVIGIEGEGTDFVVDPKGAIHEASWGGQGSTGLPPDADEVYAFSCQEAS